jgi:phenylpropionate dioxygenase-like ring-hydroxylating dioxygenase large terminal subunit
MDHDAQIEMVERIMAMHAQQTTALADATLEIPAATYASATRHAREVSTIFSVQPVLACMSVDVREPGDVVTLEPGRIPVVVVRGIDGEVHAYVNACRHRGTAFVHERGHVTRTFNCPFHGWVYDIDDGHLVAQPRSCEGFDGLDPASLGLRPLPVAERHGLVVVRPTGDQPVDVDEWLCGLGDELAAREYSTLIPYDRISTTWACNWKLLLDTFLESYHVFALHRASIGPFYLGNASPFDAFGDHNRIIVPQKSVLDQADRPRDEWELLPYAVLQYYLAPNVIVSNLYGYVLTWRFVPDAVDRTTVELSMYTYEAVESEHERKHFDERFDAARTVTSDEDFPESERVHRNLASGVVDHTNAGRNEPGIIHFHRMLEAHLAR